MPRRGVSAPHIAAQFPELLRVPDADSPSGAVRERRRLGDLAFIEWVRTATEEQLRSARMWVTCEWRRVAVARRLRAIAQVREQDGDSA